MSMEIFVFAAKQTKSFSIRPKNHVCHHSAEYLKFNKDIYFLFGSMSFSLSLTCNAPTLSVLCVLHSNLRVLWNNFITHQKRKVSNFFPLLPLLLLLFVVVVAKRHLLTRVSHRNISNLIMENTSSSIFDLQHVLTFFHHIFDAISKVFPTFFCYGQIIAESCDSLSWQLLLGFCMYITAYHTHTP